MKVFKFGGASIQSVENIKNVGSILKTYANDPVCIVISALGKTTNALERVVNTYYKGEQATALALFEEIKQSHLSLAKELLNNRLSHTESSLLDFFTEVEWLMHDRVVQSYDYYYDQIVCVGELMSSTIVSNYLNEIGFKNEWLDVRDILRTNDAFRFASVDLDFFQNAVDQQVKSILSEKSVITQGFIGSTDENESTTLGREGSDYSAALFAHALNAKNLTIWKDVPGFMTADPKVFNEANFIPSLSYQDVIELSFYGAQVVHPKTIQPLLDKKIPLYIKSFIQPAEQGTLVSEQTVKGLPPVIVKKDHQCLIEFTTPDYSFVGGKPLQTLYEILDNHHLTSHLIQVGAVSVQICLTYDKNTTPNLATSLATLGEVNIQQNLTLYTIRNYNGTLIKKYIDNDNIILLQQTNNTYQALLKN
jgi:aspartate kinase